MIVKSFHNIPCVRCQRDTLHIALKCQECGTIHETASVAYARFRKEGFLRAVRKANGNKSIAHTILHKNDKIVSAARRAECMATPIPKRRYR
jgi:hypothetical protein